ncbi:MAG: phosphate ABC transporter permease PstA [bacterium]|nr:phosphate ABC transporter permease PstA [bacterium]
MLADLPPQVEERALTQVADSEGWTNRRLVRTGNYRLTQNHFHWLSDYEITSTSYPEWAVVVERLEWGRFYGFPEAFATIELLAGEQARARVRELTDAGKDVALVVERGSRPALASADELAETGEILGVAELDVGPEAAWQRFEEHHQAVREHWRRRRELEKVDTGAVNHKQENARLALREAELERDRIAARQGSDSPAFARAETAYRAATQEYEATRTWAAGEFARIRHEIDRINAENARYQLVMRTPGEGPMAPRTTLLRLDDVVRAYPANQLSLAAKLGIYGSRWNEFLRDDPREANSEGGVFPAIFGTVAMTLIMSIAVVPFGVLGALYLREYAKAGVVVSAVRIAVNNLAGVPSIVFGVFGLGFFCYVIGAGLDELLFAARLPNPTFGKGGLMWASLTLALLTLPVVIVATEEAVAAVPNSMREGSYACGASKWQTIQRIVLPRALPGIITGMILALARGAGEVAPLMLVGAVKLAPELPIDRLFPFIHPERSFMHLGFHIFDVGFQSQNSEAAKPMVFTTTLLLIAIVAVLNFATIRLRTRLRRRFAGDQF